MCSRHGTRSFTFASPAIRETIGARGQFTAGKLVKVSLDRPKRSKLAWMTREELAQHAVIADSADTIVHVTAFPVIASIERRWVPVCPDCQDELLVRSGETPCKPTPVERAFDMSPMADNAVLSPRHPCCCRHGIVGSCVVSPAIAAAVLGNEMAERTVRPVRVTVVAPRAQSDRWFDAALLQRLFGDKSDLSSGTWTIDAGDAADEMLDSGGRVCHACLGEWLARRGLET